VSRAEKASRIENIVGGDMTIRRLMAIDNQRAAQKRAKIARKIKRLRGQRKKWRRQISKDPI